MEINRNTIRNNIFVCSIQHAGTCHIPAQDVLLTQEQTQWVWHVWLWYIIYVWYVWLWFLPKSRHSGYDMGDCKERKVDDPLAESFHRKTWDFSCDPPSNVFSLAEIRFSPFPKKIASGQRIMLTIFHEFSVTSVLLWSSVCLSVCVGFVRL